MLVVDTTGEEEGGIGGVSAESWIWSLRGRNTRPEGMKGVVRLGFGRERERSDSRCYIGGGGGIYKIVYVLYILHSPFWERIAYVEKSFHRNKKINK
jgi:hypothetical protein